MLTGVGIVSLCERKRERCADHNTKQDCSFENVQLIKNSKS